MKKLLGVMNSFLLIGVAVLGFGGMAMAQTDPPVPPEVLAQTPADTIPEGTKITPANWQQYSKFMPLGLQSLFSGKYGSPNTIGPNEGITVGPHTNLPLPKQFSDDTEKYGNQATLVPAPEWGGYNIKGYTAGTPFPNPAEPMKGLNIAYNAFFHFSPALVVVNTAGGPRVDRYGNVTWADNLVINNRMNYLSDPNYPGVHIRQRPGPYWLIEYFEVTAPENSRYSATVDMWPDDAGGQFEVYNFVPSLRRSLRLSANARCAPSSGSDTYTDDNNSAVFVQWPMFDVKFLGSAKILALANIPIESNHATNSRALENYQKVYDFQHACWQKDDSWGKWELRDVLIIGAVRYPNSPGVGSYCYGYRTAYLDKTWFNPWEVDLQDRERHFWKSQTDMRSIQPTPWGEKIWEDNGMNNHPFFDFQQRHYSFSGNPNGDVDQQNPAQYANLVRYASPAGLDQIAQ